MRDHVRLIVWMVADLFRSRAALEAEILTLRQQINLLRRTAPNKQTFSSIDRLIFVCLYRLRPGVGDALPLQKTLRSFHSRGPHDRFLVSFGTVDEGLDEVGLSLIAFSRFSIAIELALFLRPFGRGVSQPYRGSAANGLAAR